MITDFSDVVGIQETFDVLTAAQLPVGLQAPAGS